MEKLKSKLIYLSPTFKEKIYNEFNTMLYKEFNQTISDVNYFFGYKEDHLYYILEEAFEAGGPSEMRSEIDYLIRSKITIFMMNTILFTIILKNILSLELDAKKYTTKHN